MQEYKAFNKHSESTIRLLSAAQYNIFGLRKQLNILLTGLLCIGVAIFVPCGDVGFFLMMMLGCWLAVSSKVPQMRQTDKLIELMNGKYPESEFEFGETSVFVHTGGEVQELPYRKIQALADDGTYIYLFVSRMAGYMFPAKNLVPQTLDSFKSSLSSLSGLEFVKPCSLFRMSIKQLGIRIKNRRVLKARIMKKK